MCIYSSPPVFSQLAAAELGTFVTQLELSICGGNKEEELAIMHVMTVEH